MIYKDGDFVYVEFNGNGSIPSTKHIYIFKRKLIYLYNTDLCDTYASIDINNKEIIYNDICHCDFTTRLATKYEIQYFLNYLQKEGKDWDFYNNRLIDKKIINNYNNTIEKDYKDYINKLYPDKDTISKNISTSDNLYYTTNPSEFKFCINNKVYYKNDISEAVYKLVKKYNLSPFKNLTEKDFANILYKDLINLIQQ